MAENLAQEGRSTDSVVGHLTPGEIVVPKEMLSNTTLRRSLIRAFKEHGADINEFTVGHEANKINPETGYPEFFFKKIFKGVKKAVKSVGKVVKKAAKTVAKPFEKAGQEIKSTFDSIERRTRRATYGRQKYLTQKYTKQAQRQTAAEIKAAEDRMQAERDRMAAAHAEAMEAQRIAAAKARAKDITRGIKQKKEHEAMMASLKKPNVAVSDQVGFGGDYTTSFKRRIRRSAKRAAYGDRGGLV